MIEPESLQQVDRTYVICEGRKLSYFSGCDYFRLATHPEILRALRTGEQEFGLNVAASRLTSGNHVLFDRLENELARYFGCEAATLVSSGYLGSMVVAQAVAGNFSHALLDDRAHPALSDASRFLDCPVLRFRHRDPKALATAANRCGSQARLLVLTDGMFSHDGSVAPLGAYLEVLPADALLLVDDAHGAGLLGKTGKGTPEYNQVPTDRILRAITLSKAFGTFGGAVLGDSALRKDVIARSHAFSGATPIPLPMAAAALAAVEVLDREGKELRDRLQANAQSVKSKVRDAGMPLEEHPGPIIPFVPESAAQKSRLTKTLLEAEIYPPFIRYPTSPGSGYFRFVISSEHTPQQLETLAATLVEARCPGKGQPRQSARAATTLR